MVCYCYYSQTLFISRNRNFFQGSPKFLLPVLYPLPCPCDVIEDGRGRLAQLHQELVAEARRQVTWDTCPGALEEKRCTLRHDLVISYTSNKTVQLSRSQIHTRFSSYTQDCLKKCIFWFHLNLGNVIVFKRPHWQDTFL